MGIQPPSFPELIDHQQPSIIGHFSADSNQWLTKIQYTAQ
jgi:hypothetical protein